MWDVTKATIWMLTAFFVSAIVVYGVVRLAKTEAEGSRVIPANVPRSMLGQSYVPVRFGEIEEMPQRPPVH